MALDEVRTVPTQAWIGRQPGAPWRRVPSDVKAHWHGLSLTTRFAATASLVVLVGMLALGWWLNERIKYGVVQHSAANAAVYLVGMMEPHLQDLATSETLSETSRARLDGIYAQLAERRRIVALKVWGRDGRLLFSGDKRLEGRAFPVSRELQSAWLGNISTEYDDLSHAENEVERRLDLPILEIYLPVRAAATHEVIAVVEVYEVAEALARDLRLSSIETALVLAAIALVMIGSLFQIVQRGSRTIVSQQSTLADKVAELSHLLRANTRLQRRVADANRRAAAANEQYLRRIGADLHDGPAQLIGFSLLRLDALRPRLSPPARRPDGAEPIDDLDVIQGALRDGLGELRSICADIAIPDLRDVGLTEAIRTAIRNHEHRTSTRVDTDLAAIETIEVPMALVTCLYRFVQEGLNNAFRHAGGVGQRVSARLRDEILEVTVADKGPGLGDRNTDSGLGLAGLRERVFATGGTFETHSAPGEGTRLTVRFTIDTTTSKFCGPYHV